MTQKLHDASSQREIEIKLAIGKRANEALDWREILDGYQGKQPVTRRLRSIYFDTSSHGLRTNKMSLRVRQIDESWRQTLKLETDVRGGLSNPIEVECDVAGPKPDLRAISDARLRKRLRKAIGSNQLKPIFETDVYRTTQVVTGAGGSQIEIALDDAAIRTDEGSQEFAEVELELKQGRPSALMDVVKTLSRTVAPIIPCRYSKAEQGYRFLLKETDAELKPAKMTPSKVTPGQKCSGAFRTVSASTVRQVLHNWLVVLHSDDPEGPHQLRIGIRYLRTMLRAFRPAIDSEALRVLERDLRELGQVVGQLRDLDVLSSEVVGVIDWPRELGVGSSDLERALQSQKEIQRATVREALLSQQMQTLQIRLALLPSQLGWEHALSDKRLARKKIESVARNALNKSWRRALTLGKRIDALSIEERHSLRKQLKGLRYTLDAFSPLYRKKECRRFIKDLKRLQEIFGYLNDARLAEQLHDTDTKFQKNAKAFQQSIGYVIGYQASITELTWHRAKRRWNDLVLIEQPWR